MEWRVGLKYRLARAIVAGCTLPIAVAASSIGPTAQAADIRHAEWYLDAMQAPKMWQVSTGRGITVAVIDSGVDASAPELQGHVLPGRDFQSGNGDGREDPDGHGTEMAMIIAGSGNSGGVTGLASDAKILPLRVGVSGKAAVQEFADAIKFAADRQARVINVSAGFPALDRTSTILNPLENAVQYALNRGSLIFAATGNDGDKGNYPVYPAGIPGVVGISAVDETGTWLKFSTHGPQVALAAPGKDVPGRCSKTLGDQTGYCLGAGTSEATAIASASAALIWAKHPDWTGNQVLWVMINTASRPTSGPVPNEFVGYGVVRPRVALLGDPGNPGPPNVNPLLAAKDSKSTSTPTVSQSAGTDRSVSKGNLSAGSHTTTYWVALGAGIIVVITGTGAFLMLRRRRTRSYGKGS